MSIENRTEENKHQKLIASHVNHIHFVGVGGSGMNGIAELLKNQGYHVSGSDMNENKATSYLKSIGVEIFKGHHPDHVSGADIVVLSSAILDDNPEVVAAHEARIPTIPRAQMLAEIMRSKQGIAVAGTHGKTTTTSLVASVLAEGGLDPTFVIGGLLNSAGTNARLGASQFFVAEADESDASFLFLKPQITIVTNIDADHLWAYDGSFEQLKKTFVRFLHHLPLNGLAILCIDDPIVRELLPQIARPFVTYGVADDADFQLTDYTQEGIRSFFNVHVGKTDEVLSINLNLPGLHNSLNAVASVAVAKTAGVENSAIVKALSEFEGIGRRFQMRGAYQFENGEAQVIDDYGHHPREVAATIKAVRAAWPDKRLVLVFQPHRYSRTKNLFEDFSQVLSEVDQLLLLDIYPAGEKPISGITGRSLCRAIRQRGQVEPVFVGRNEDIKNLLPNILKDGDILLMQGAGDVGGMAANLIP